MVRRPESIQGIIPTSAGKAYHIKEIVNGRYYYPKLPGTCAQSVYNKVTYFIGPFTDGLGETSDKSRPLRNGEVAEWIVLDGVSSFHDCTLC